MLKLPSIRSVNFIAAASCFFLLLTAAFLQYELHLKPCPLCVIQRIIILILGVFFLIGGLINFKRTSHRLYHFMIFLLTGLGILVAGRHVWLETLPAGQVEECGPTLTYILDMLPFDQAFQFLFAGHGHCGAIKWQLFEFSIPHWTLAFFILFALIAVWQFFRKKRGNF
jgi:disulfide bond formation protein DsbB